MVETILNNWIVTKFALPFLLVFFITFAILEKTNLLGEGKKQLNALISFVIGLIFVLSFSKTEVIDHLMLFLVIALVIVFVILILWGFVTGGNLKENILDNGPLKWVSLGVIIIAVTIAVLWATGYENNVFNFLFRQSWSESFWTNVIFIALIAIALAFVMRSSSSK